MNNEITNIVSESYDENSIQVLEGLEAVRKRPGMYIGSTGERGLHHLVYEIVDNSIDEALAGYCDKITVELLDDGIIRVADNGRGIPVGINPQKGIPTVTVVFTILHAGGKFGGGGYKVSGGLHGVGASVVNALSNWLEVEVRDGKNVYKQRYEKGTIVTDLTVIGETDETGTTVTFKPDPTIFTDTTTYDYDILLNRLREQAFLNAGIRIVLTDKRTDDAIPTIGKSDDLCFEGGIKSYVEYLLAGIKKESLINDVIYLSGSKGDAFVPRVTTHKISDNTEITIIEPPCGSNTAIIKSNGEYLFVDSGYAYYADEMKKLLHSLIPDFDSIRKKILVTHADVDHCGLLYMFDEIIASKRTLECFEAESRMEDGFREKNPLHKPYIRICKALTEYMPPDTHKISTPFSEASFENSVLSYSGHLNFGELSFEVYEGKGGHLPGEIVLIDYDKKVAFTGDIYINLDGLTPEQREYNRYAPILMTSVDTDPKLCAEERRAILGRLGVGQWQIFGAHGFKKDYSVNYQ